MNAVPAARLDEVSVRFCNGDESVWALRNVSLTIPAASSTAVVGRSGSGKSTLVSVLALLRRPTTGSVTINETATGGMKDAELAALRARHVSTVFQSFHLDPAMSAVENVMLPWYFGARMSRRAARSRAASLLDRMEIGELASRRASQLSGGQRQRVAIARALFAEPRILIADEPTGNLDEETADVIARHLLSLAADLGTAVVVVTHDQQIASRAARRIRLVGGQLAGE
jgi:ABC-type lipoprotein export system ATPase subunit